MSSPILFEAASVGGGYGDIRIVHDVSLRVRAGEVVCITGRNGVGKSTLMRLLAGFLDLMEGEVRLRGERIDACRPHERNRGGLAYAPQENVAFPTLSVRDNLTLHFADRSLERYGALFQQFPRIAERLDQKAGTLSGGERKILSFCRAMGEARDLTLLDEPTEGVQPENIGRMAQAIRGRAALGAGFVVVEQNLTLIEQAADHVVLMDHGRCVFETVNGPGMREAIVSRLQL